MNSNDDALKLFVAGLPDSVTEEALRDLFAESGAQVQDLTLPRDRMTGSPRGFAFVRLGSPEDVERSLSMLNGHMLGGVSISVRRFQSEAPARGERPVGGGRGPAADTSERTLYVGNLPFDATQEEIEALLHETGTEVVTRVHLPLGPDGRKRGFGFVTLGSSDAAKAAVDALRGATLRGRPLVVNLALPKAAPGTGGPRPERSFGGPPGGPPGIGGPPPGKFGPPARPGGKNDFSKRKKTEGNPGGGRNTSKERRGGESHWTVDDDD